MSFLKAKYEELLVFVNYERLKDIILKQGKEGPVSLRKFLKEFWEEAFEEHILLNAGLRNFRVTCEECIEKIRVWICEKV